MAREGYNGATIIKIAQEADLSSGLVHYHFDDKEEILLSAVDLLTIQFEQRYRVLLEAAGDNPRKRLYAFIDAHLALGPGSDESAVAAWVVVGSEAVRNFHVRHVYSRSVKKRMEELEDLILQFMRSRGKRGPLGSSAKAASVLAAIEGHYQLSAAAPKTLPRGTAAMNMRIMVEGFVA